MRKQDEASGVALTSWGGEFPRRAALQASDRSGGIRQCLWRMVST
jgi:hypothetical protein